MITTRFFLIRFIVPFSPFSPTQNAASNRGRDETYHMFPGGYGKPFAPLRTPQVNPLLLI